jgi:hypothetical protein
MERSAGVVCKVWLGWGAGFFSSMCAAAADTDREPNVSRLARGWVGKGTLQRLPSGCHSRFAGPEAYIAAALGQALRRQ